MSEEQDTPKLSAFANDQIEQLALSAVAQIVHVTTMAIASIVGNARDKISETITNADIERE